MNANVAEKSAKKKPAGVFLKNALKGTLVSMVFTVAAILLFALIIKETGLADSVIAPINQIIKIGGIMAASYFAIKGLAEKQWITGGLAGMMFILLSYLVFSLIEGMFGNIALLFSDMLMGMLVGMVFAIIIANFTKTGRRTSKTSKKRSLPFRRSK
ncbi:MAG: TIGR04086 family membrane protein [Christensenellales bacterium]